MSSGQLVSAGIHLITALAFAFVGWRLMTRFATSSEARPAMVFFGLYWAALGGSALTQFALLVLAALGPVGLEFSLRLLFILAFAIVYVGLAGFMYYLAYIFTGRRVLSSATFVVYLLFGAGQVLLTIQGSVTPGDTDFTYPFYTNVSTVIFPPEIAYVLTLVPFVLGTFGLILLGFKTGRVRTHYRAILVGGALLFWAGSSAAAFAIHFKGLLELVPQLVAFGAALAVYLAYFPPAFIEARLDEMEDAERSKVKRDAA
ncbi:MAG: hypothetical protein HY556_11880 [Euryarchaeota archaeon]|nr:hypothetical protein [Euryarchaeota archaeon]